jgi:hypothetical protein
MPLLTGPATQLLHQPKSACVENLLSEERPDVDQRHATRMAVDRVNDVSQDCVERLSVKGMEEIRHREVVGHLVFRGVRDHDLDVSASVLMTTRRETGASDLGQGGRDLDANDFSERPSRGLMYHSAFSASEVHERVALGDSYVTERARQHMPARGQVGQSIGMFVLGQLGMRRGVDPSVQHEICQPLGPTHELGPQPLARLPGPRCGAGNELFGERDLSRRLMRPCVFRRPLLKPFDPSPDVLGLVFHVSHATPRAAVAGPA